MAEAIISETSVSQIVSLYIEGNENTPTKNGPLVTKTNAFANTFNIQTNHLTD